MGHVASPPTLLSPHPRPLHVILSLASTGTVSDPTTVCLPTGMQARVIGGGLMASQGLFRDQELISVLTLYWRLVTVVKNGPMCSLPLKHNLSLSCPLNTHTRTHIHTHKHKASLGSCKVETRGCEASEVSCGPVFSNSSFILHLCMVSQRHHYNQKLLMPET